MTVVQSKELEKKEAVISDLWSPGGVAALCSSVPLDSAGWVGLDTARKT